MPTDIVVSLIAAGGGLLGSVLGVMASSKLTIYRIEQLEQKVDKHNNVVERVYRVEGHLDVIDEQIRVANHRLKDLEEE